MRMGMRVRPLPVLSIFATAALGACASNPNQYPSLALRPAERVTAVYGAPVAVPTPELLPQPDGSVLSQLDSLVAQAQRGDARFQRGEKSARRLVGQAGRAQIGSEQWALATTAVSELEAARGETMTPLAELDRMFAEAVTQGQDTTAIVKARDAVIAIVGRQDAVLGEIRANLGD